MLVGAGFKTVLLTIARLAEGPKFAISHARLPVREPGMANDIAMAWG